MSAAFRRVEICQKGGKAMVRKGINGKALSAILVLLAHSATRADDAENLAKKLSNPIASLISVPFQYNFDHDIEPAESGLNEAPKSIESPREDFRRHSRGQSAIWIHHPDDTYRS
jgi:hypothetical protein